MNIESIAWVGLVALVVLAVLWFRRPRWFRAAARVVDGDSLRIEGHSVRLAGIDAPEHNQVGVSRGQTVRLGHEATRAMRRLIGEGMVSYRVLSVDRYGRMLAVVRNEAGQDVGRELVRQGWAVAYGYQTRHQARRYWLAQLTARLSRRGMWGMCAKVSPAAWRMANPRKG